MGLWGRMTVEEIWLEAVVSFLEFVCGDCKKQQRKKIKMKERG
jgi:hypothetical protein